LYNCKTPDQPGGGTVEWTNPWGEYKFIDNIEIREDGGTPGFIQAIRTAFALELKKQMDPLMIHLREQELTALAFREFRKIPEIQILAGQVEERLGVLSFYFPGIHYNLIVQLLSDRFGIQVRGGCACAGTYGHYLLSVSHATSRKITEKINNGDLSDKPGWVRMSLHPTMKDEEVYYIADAIKQIQKNHPEWGKDYQYLKHTNEFRHLKPHPNQESVENWFVL
jgi:selenocysteine lyase/cysteine desulfurase